MFKRIKVVTLLLLLLIHGVSFGQHSADEANVSERMILEALKGDKAARVSVAKADKGKVLRCLQLVALQRSMDPALKREALEMIKSIPDHTSHFRDQIKNDKSGGVNSAVSDAFDILGHLKTKESLKVLGEFLFDPSNPSGTGTSCTPDPSPNRLIALRVISEAKIEGAPKRELTTTNLDLGLQEWRDWWRKTHPEK